MNTSGMLSSLMDPSRLLPGAPLECRHFSNAGGIRGSRGGNIAIERRRRYAEAMRDLGNADVGIGQHRLGGLNVACRPANRTISALSSPFLLLLGQAPRLA